MQWNSVLAYSAAGVSSRIRRNTGVPIAPAGWGRHFRERQAPKLTIGAMMRKLVHIAFGVLKSGKTFDPALQGGLTGL